MTRPIRWTARAAQQLVEASLYLEQARTGQGSLLIDHVEALLDLAALHPLTFPRVPAIDGNEVRRGLVRRYRTWVIYEIRPDELVVLSVWHGSRRPEAWRQD